MGHRLIWRSLTPYMIEAPGRSCGHPRCRGVADGQLRQRAPAARRESPPPLSDPVAPPCRGAGDVTVIPGAGRQRSRSGSRCTRTRAPRSPRAAGIRSTARGRTSTSPGVRWWTAAAGPCSRGVSPRAMWCSPRRGCCVRRRAVVEPRGDAGAGGGVTPSAWRKPGVPRVRPLRWCIAVTIGGAWCAPRPHRRRAVAGPGTAPGPGAAPHPLRRVPVAR